MSIENFLKLFVLIASLQSAASSAHAAISCGGLFENVKADTARSLTFSAGKTYRSFPGLEDNLNAIETAKGLKQGSLIPKITDSIEKALTEIAKDPSIASHLDQVASKELPYVYTYLANVQNTPKGLIVLYSVEFRKEQKQLYFSVSIDSRSAKSELISYKVLTLAEIKAMDQADSWLKQFGLSRSPNGYDGESLFERTIPGTLEKVKALSKSIAIKELTQRFGDWQEGRNGYNIFTYSLAATLEQATWSEVRKVDQLNERGDILATMALKTGSNHLKASLIYILVRKKGGLIEQIKPSEAR